MQNLGANRVHYGELENRKWKKSTHGFPFLSYASMGLRLAAITPREHRYNNT